MRALRLDRQVAAPSRPAAFEASPRQRELLNACRLTVMACQSLRRAELFEECAMLSSDRAAARAAYLEILVRCLPQAIRRTPRIHRHGVQELTFDEAWLMTIHDAMARQDAASFKFVLRSRGDRLARRNLVFLLCRIAERADRQEARQDLS